MGVTGGGLMRGEFGGVYAMVVRRVIDENATPAEAGAQLGDVANGAWSSIIATFPPGPRPSPGWCSWEEWLPSITLFPREGGDPDWAPAFAGEQGGGR